MARTKKTKTSDARVNVRNLVAVKMTIHRWSGQTFDKNAAAQVERQNQADPGSVKATVLLIPKHWNRKVASAASRLRAMWDAMSLPWEDGGWRVVHATRYEEIMEKAVGFVQEYQRASDELVRNYPRLRKGAMKRLGDLYDEDAFPTKAEVESLFSTRVYQRPIVTGKDVRVLGLSEHAVENMRHSIEEQLTNQINTALASLIDQLRQLVTDALTRYDKDDQKRVRYNGLQKRVEKTCDSLQILNVTNSPDVGALIESVREVLTKEDPALLREDKSKKNKAKKAARSVLNDLDSFGL